MRVSTVPNRGMAHASAHSIVPWVVPTDVRAGLPSTGESADQDEAAPAKKTIAKLLNDSDGEVRAYAAWAAIQVGQKAKGVAALRDLIVNNDPGMVTILNVVDYVGDVAKPLAPAIAKVDPKKNHLESYVNRQIEYFGEKW